MFGRRRKQQEQVIEDLTGATGALDRALAQLLDRIDPSASRDAFQVSYYSMAVVSNAFLMYSKQSETKKFGTLDAYSSRLLPKLVQYHRPKEDRSAETLIKEYQAVYSTYSALLHDIFAKKKDSSAITLMMVLWQAVTGQPPRGRMVEIAAFSPLLIEFTGEAFKIVRQRV